MQQLSESEQFILQCGDVVERVKPGLLLSEEEVKERKILSLLGKIIGDKLMGIDRYKISELDFTPFVNEYRRLSAERLQQAELVKPEEPKQLNP